MKRITWLLAILLVFSIWSVGSAEEIKVKEIFSSVAAKMGIQQLDENIALPKIKILPEEEFIREVVKLMVRDFKDTPFWKSLEGKSQEEIVQEFKNLYAQAREREDYELANNSGLYDPYANIIYLKNGSSLFVLVHEVAHYFQVKYQKRYPESNEIFKNVSEEEKEEISKKEDKLEEEADGIAEEFRKEFFSTKITAKVSTNEAPY